MWVMNEEQVYNPAPIKMAELIKWDLAKAGVDVKVRSVTRTYLIEQLRKGTEDYDLILTGWLAGNLDPDGFMRPILSCECNPEFDKMMNRALATNHLYERSKAYNNAQDLVLNELPIVPIANVKRLLVARGNVKGIEMTPFGSINFSTLYFMKNKENK